MGDHRVVNNLCKRGEADDQAAKTGQSKNKTLYPQRTQPVSPQATFGGDPVSPQDTACIPRGYVQAIFGPEPVSPEATLLESTIGMQLLGLIATR